MSQLEVLRHPPESFPRVPKFVADDFWKELLMQGTMGGGMKCEAANAPRRLWWCQQATKASQHDRSSLKDPLQLLSNAI